MPEYKMQAEKRAEIQASAVSLNTIHKKVMQTKGGQQLETEMISFRLTVQTEIELGATREIFDSLFEGGKIPTDSQAYAIISAVLTKFNAANGLTGASGGGGGGGSKKQKAKTGKASKAAKKTVKKNATIQEATIAATLAAIKSNLESNFAESKIDGKQTTATLSDKAEIERIVKKSVRAIADKVATVSDALPMAKASKADAKKTVAANKMPPANSKRNAKAALTS